MYIENSYLKKQFSIWLLLMLLIISIIIIVGGLTRLTDSGLSITEWELFSGFLPPFNESDWDNYFNLYKKIPEYQLQNFSMAVGVSGRDKTHILVRNISNKVPNYNIHRNLKEAEIKVFNESAKRAAKMEREELSKLWDINNKYYGSFCFKKNWGFEVQALYLFT